jgi:tRNA(His) 5'-end guanylyltransferase
MVGQANFSHKELQNKSCDDIQEMLFKEKGINWNNYSSFCKRGTYIKRVKTKRKFTISELDKLSPKHEARINPNLEVERNDYKIIEFPILTTIKNRVETIF